MTQEILEKMEERKKFKHGQTEDTKRKYKQLKTEIRKLCRQKKEEFINRECEGAEHLERIDSAKFHKKIKDLTWTMKKVTHSLNDKNGVEIFDPKQILNRWKEYCQDLYADDRPNTIVDNIVENEIPHFTTDDIKNAISKLNNKKSPGSDSIPAEFLKLLDIDGITLITDIINSIYQTGQIPVDFLESVFITIPKINKAKNCSDFRTISLISHASKILLILLKSRINHAIEQNLT
ncbi:uncharacterized protein LOC108254040, partial [Diaphorina citri]|uniref:Uncharacterized protein LOC108254040 n=1 Tax=Diaphorina citri TaxID=121845 RepID=A0A1S4EQZ4_DIACI